MSHKTRREGNFELCLSQKRGGKSKNIIQLKNKISKTPEKLSLLTLVTNYHKLSLLPLWLDPDENLKNKNRCQIFSLAIVTSNKLYFHSLHKIFKCTANKQRELNFCRKFYPFMQLLECMG